jgi:hypothetical protein
MSFNSSTALEATSGTATTPTTGSRCLCQSRPNSAEEARKSRAVKAGITGTGSISDAQRNAAITSMPNSRPNRRSSIWP